MTKITYLLFFIWLSFILPVGAALAGWPEDDAVRVCINKRAQILEKIVHEADGFYLVIARRGGFIKRYPCRQDDSYSNRFHCDRGRRTEIVEAQYVASSRRFVCATKLEQCINGLSGQAR